MHTNSSIHTRSIERSILGTENGTKRSEKISSERERERGKPSNDPANGTGTDIHGCSDASLGRSDDVVLLECDDGGGITLSSHDGEESSEESDSDTRARHD